ncbi:MAG: bifunctional hydroxymethylpyrimidine kinase/phosphomethylpyrimidine kinase [Eubacteriales bacterium]|nr:bifunctional hydroxymethylpyrimidine kinase/phosphomethylpyrimidine kinase [Eubacteriales bacterium]
MLFIKKILTIAGSDCSGGAGIQADIKTITAHKMYAMSAITALTAQNTTGVYGVMDASPEFVSLQLDCIFKDIRPDAVKIGMVSNAEIIEVISSKLREYNAKNIVVDPVMISTSGSKLLCDDAIETLKKSLLPIGTVITPNIPEAEVLCGFEIKNASDMERAAAVISKLIPGAVLIKGGHLVNDACDLLYFDNKIQWLMGERIENENTHGTGCTLSSAIACELAEGRSLYDSVSRAKTYITGALKAELNLGKGSGPLEHTYNIKL